MKVELSPAVSLALNQAGQYAQRDGCTQVQPLHLLLGLIHEQEGHASSLLRDAGLEPTRVQNAFAGANKALGIDTTQIVPLSERNEAVLRRARELSRTNSAELTVSTDQVLVALLHEEPDLRERLEELGLKFSRIEDELSTQQGPPLQLDEPLDLREPGEDIDVARILDANANRAREALRVLEDNARFHLDDAMLSGELKAVRHGLAQALSRLPVSMLIEARDALGDVGATVSTKSEYERQSLRDVVEANAKRLQEALRCLEEYGKILHPDFGAAIETLRYRSYTIERSLLIGGAALGRLAQVRLCALVTDRLCRHSLVGTAAEAIAGGAQMIQLREKGCDDRDFLDQARQLRELCKKAGALFIVNDRADIARLVDADGVHVGQDDLPVHEARRVVGGNALIGVSTHHVEQLHQAILDGASYVGVGPTFPSTTKEFGKYSGLDYIRQASAETTLPAFAIGGITQENVEQVVAAGARRIAVSAAICSSENPRKTASELLKVIESQPL